MVVAERLATARWDGVGVRLLRHGGASCKLAVDPAKHRRLLSHGEDQGLHDTDVTLL